MTRDDPSPTPRRVGVFCGSSPGEDPAYLRAAGELGEALVAAGYELVYGGATCGLMGRVADAALAAGGAVHGVIPRFFTTGKELQHRGLTSLLLTDSMHARRVAMVEMSDAFVALPGGFGTLDETFEVLTLAQLGAHAGPTGFLDLGGYYAPILKWAADAVAAGFVRPEHLELFFAEADPARLVARLATHRMPAMPDLVGGRI